MTTTATSMSQERRGAAKDNEIPWWAGNYRLTNLSGKLLGAHSLFFQ